MNAYTAYKKLGTKPEESAVPEDCYAKRAKIWLWLLGILVSGVSVYALVVFSGQDHTVVPVSGPSPAGGGIHVQPVALAQCPYCPGYLDAQGRCNVRGCPVYSPDWGATPVALNTGLEPVRIKELALEVLEKRSSRGVVIHTVYVGGNADKAGLREGDLISKFNGHRVRTVEDLQMSVVRAKPEAMVKVRIIRNGRRLDSNLSVMIGEGEMEGAAVPVFRPATGPARCKLL